MILLIKSEPTGLTSLYQPQKGSHGQFWRVISLMAILDKSWCMYVYTLPIQLLLILHTQCRILVENTPVCTHIQQASIQQFQCHNCREDFLSIWGFLFSSKGENGCDKCQVWPVRSRERLANTFDRFVNGEPVDSVADNRKGGGQTDEKEHVNIPTLSSWGEGTKICLYLLGLRGDYMYREGPRETWRWTGTIQKCQTLLLENKYHTDRSTVWYW